jgi:NAD(P)-dependent dehydrogenase (short-subunit alcohol dehydrogenase family)
MFQNKVALVTGGNSGIGLASAEMLAAQGASVIIVGRDAKTLETARLKLGSRALAIRADIAQVSEIERVMQEVRRAQVPLDILFINAGISHCPPLAETTEKDFNHIVDINFKGAFFTFTKALPLLREGSSVIFTCSAAHDRGRPGDPLYAASKAAIRSLVRTLAADEQVLQKKIRVNAVTPGAVLTPLTKQDSAEATAQIDAYIANAVPLGRWGKPEEIAKAVLFLASSDSSYMTGAEIAVDGGLAQI